jgi:hypothetical protein
MSLSLPSGRPEFKTHPVPGVPSDDPVPSVGSYARVTGCGSMLKQQDGCDKWQLPAGPREARGMLAGCPWWPIVDVTLTHSLTHSLTQPFSHADTTTMHNKLSASHQSYIQQPCTTSYNLSSRANDSS